MLYLRFGLGRHAVVVSQEDPENLSRFLQTIVANEIVYTTGLACARLSIVALYYRIFGSSNMYYFLQGFAAFIVAWAIATASTSHASVGSVLSLTLINNSMSLPFALVGQ